MKNKKAFTLVELLVVISIIALLLSILMPSLNKARESAKKIVCASGIHGTMVAFATYSISYKDYLPYSGRPFPYMGMLDFANLLVSQGLDCRKIHCPSDPYKPGSVAYWWKNNPTFSRPMDARDHIARKVPVGVTPEVPYSYYYNVKMYVDYDSRSGDIVWASMKQWKLSDVKYPSRLIPYTCFDPTWGGRHSPKGKTSKLNDISKGGHQAGFFDGRAEFVPFTKITDRSPIGQAAYGGVRNLDYTKNGIRGIDVK